MKQRVRNVEMDVTEIRVEYNTRNVAKAHVGEFKGKFFYWWEVRCSTHGKMVQPDPTVYEMSIIKAQQKAIDLVVEYLESFDDERSCAIKSMMQEKRLMLGQLDLFDF